MTKKNNEIAEITRDYDDFIFKMEKSLKEAADHREMNLRSAHILLDRIFHYLVKNSDNGVHVQLNKDLQNLALNRRMEEETQEGMRKVRTYLLELRAVLKEIK